MIKMASGVAAKVSGPRGFMLSMATAVAIAIPPALYAWGASTPLIVWLILNGVVLAFSTLVCAIMWSEGQFDWRDADRPPVLWSVMAAWTESAKPS